MGEPAATAFLGFVLRFIPDINFKISLASIKIATLLLQQDVASLKPHFSALLGHLVEKLSDSKQIVRDMVMDCCSNLISRSKPLVFANNILSSL